MKTRLINFFDKGGFALCLAVILTVMLSSSALATGVTIRMTQLVSGQGGALYDANGSTPLASGDIVQIINVGANGTIDPPNTANAHYTGGDDSWIADVHVGDGTGGAAGTLYSQQGSIGGVTIYLRALNVNALSGTAKYGNSVTQSVSGGGGQPANWPVPSITTNQNITPVTTPTLSGISPSSSNQGQTLDVTLTGANTTWSGAQTVTFSGSGITVNSATASNATTINANISIAAGAATGARTVTVGGTSGSVTFTINAPGSNHPPVANTISVTATQGAATTVTFSATDADGDALTYSIANYPLYGTLGTVSGNHVTYTPPAGSSVTSDTFTYKANDGKADSNIATVNVTVTPATAIVIDDFEGGCVGNFKAPNINSGYYVFQNSLDITPTDESMNTQLRKAEAKKNGTLGAKVRYSYNGTDGTDWGGGWGAKLIKTLDLSLAKSITLNVQWDGSSNDMILSFKDSDGTAANATVANATLMGLGGYNQVTIDKASFAVDPTSSDNGADNSFDWTQVVSYNFIFKTKATSTNYMYIDDITAQLGSVIPPLSGNSISVSPPAGPSGSPLTITWVKGNTFGPSQGNSFVMFTNKATGATSTSITVLSWSDTQIKALVPSLPAGAYDVAVHCAANASGTVQAFTTDPAGFQIRAGGGTDTPAIYPNPFNPGTEVVTIALIDTKGATNIDFYIFDMTARLAKRVSGTNSQITWDGKDTEGNLAGNGAYLVRIVNADTKSLIAKGKLLVIRH